MDKRGEREVQQNSDAGWGQQHHSMWQQHCSICCCNIAAAVAMQHATASGSGEALQQLLSSARASMRYWRGFCSSCCQLRVTA